MTRSLNALGSRFLHAQSFQAVLPADSRISDEIVSIPRFVLFDTFFTS